MNQYFKYELSDSSDMKEASVYDIMLSTSNILFSNITMPADNFIGSSIEFS